MQQAARCANKGYAAVVLDYSSMWYSTGLPLNNGDWPPYLNWIMSTIKNLGMSAGPVGGNGYLSNATLLLQMDFAVAWTCVEFNNCGEFMPLGESLSACCMRLGC
jgi:hypothetical protein